MNIINDARTTLFIAKNIIVKPFLTHLSESELVNQNKECTPSMEGVLSD